MIKLSKFQKHNDLNNINTQIPIFLSYKKILYKTNITNKHFYFRFFWNTRNTTSRTSPWRTATSSRYIKYGVICVPVIAMQCPCKIDLSH